MLPFPDVAEAPSPIAAHRAGSSLGERCPRSRRGAELGGLQAERLAGLRRPR